MVDFRSHRIPNFLMARDGFGGANHEPFLPEAIDRWITDSAMWLPSDVEVKRDWSAAVRQDLDEAERRALRLWLQDEPVDPETLATISIKLADCCRTRAEMGRAVIAERIRGKSGRANLLDLLLDGQLSVMAAGVVDRAMDMMTPEEVRVLADARIEDASTATWGAATAIYVAERDVILVGGATDIASLGHETVHRAAEMIREQLLTEAIAIGSQGDRTAPVVSSALLEAERIVPPDRTITGQRWVEIHAAVISRIAHDLRPEVLCVLTVWADKHPHSEAATWRLATEYWAHRACRESDVKRDILCRAVESGVQLPREPAWTLPD